MIVQKVLARIKATEGIPFRFVGGAMAYAALAKGPEKHQLPAAFVLPLAMTAGDNRLTTGFRQRHVDAVGVVMVIAAVNSPAGAGADTALEAVHEALLAALAGWQPSADHEPMEFRRGALLDVGGGLVWWQDEFDTASHR